jgi:DNA methylase
MDRAVGYWFSEPVLARLSAVKELIRERGEPERTMLMAIFSSIIVRVSYQDSDTRYAKVGRDATTADVDAAIKRKLREVIANLSSVRVPGRAPTKVVLADARSVPFIDTGSVSLVVTSPPYLNAYDYHKYHRQRLHWIDGDIAFARDFEIGSHDEFTKPNATANQYFLDLKDCFAEWWRLLKRRGRCLLLIGDAIVNKRPVAVADTFVTLATQCGFRLEDRCIRELQATKRAFNVKNCRISHEHVLLFQKP